MKDERKDWSNAMNEVAAPTTCELTCVICRKKKTKVYWDTIEGISTLSDIKHTEAHDLRIPMCQECWEAFGEIDSWHLRVAMIGFVRGCVSGREEAANREGVDVVG